MSIVSEIFEAGFDLYKFLTQHSRGSNVLKSLLIRELRDNLKRLEHRNRADVNRKALIEKLENQNILRAISEGFQFNKLAKDQQIDDGIVNKIPQSIKYKNWDCNQFITSIDEKITSLKDLPGLYSDLENAPINLTLRLNNLHLQCLLVTLLIKKSTKN
jgi:hypothetical protein